MWTDVEFTRNAALDVTSDDRSSAHSAATVVRTSNRPSSLFPVAIKQILDDNDVLQISGFPVTMMRVVGIVRNISVSTTKVTYRIQDWSGSITAIQWLESSNNQIGVVENTYVRMSGTRKTQDDKIVFLVYDIVSVQDMNEIIHHQLLVIYTPLKVEETVQTEEININNRLKLPSVHVKVHFFIQQAKSDLGISRTEILQNVKISPEALDKIIEFLITEGHIYCTSDDDHFRATDS